MLSLLSSKRLSDVLSCCQSVKRRDEGNGIRALQMEEVRSIGSLPCLEHVALLNNPLSIIPDYRTKVLAQFGERASEVGCQGRGWWGWLDQKDSRTEPTPSQPGPPLMSTVLLPLPASEGLPHSMWPFSSGKPAASPRKNSLTFPAALSVSSQWPPRFPRGLPPISSSRVAARRAPHEPTGTA